MSELYVSDLDGTLLNRNAELSAYTIITINQLIDDGMFFTISTARTAETVRTILGELHIQVPICLINGVSIFDLQNNRYIKTEFIPPQSVIRIIELLSAFNQTGFLYSLIGNTLSTFYENADSSHRQAFMEERIRKYNKVFTKVRSFQECKDEPIIHFSLSDKKELLEPVCIELKKDRLLHIEFYRDIYHEDNWYLEICSSHASKYNAVIYLRDYFGFSKIIGFGDNLNDLSLFRACDECYAVENARKEVIEKASAIIQSNHNDGVAKFLMNRFYK